MKITLCARELLSLRGQAMCALGERGSRPIFKISQTKMLKLCSKEFRSMCFFYPLDLCSETELNALG